MLTIYIASTSSDLASFQQAVSEKLPDSGLLQCVVSPDCESHVDVLTEVRRRIAAAEILLAIVGFARAIEIDGDSQQRSLAEFEYDVALELGKICLICLQPPARGELAADERQLRFRERVGQQRLIAEDFRSPQGLASEVVRAVQNQVLTHHLSAAQREEEEAAVPQGWATANLVYHALDQLSRSGAFDPDAALRATAPPDPSALGSIMEQQAQKHTRQESSHNSDSGDDPMRLAQQWVHTGAVWMLSSSQKAIDAFRTAVELDPNQAVAWRKLGNLYLRTGQLNHAKDAFEEQLILARHADEKYSEADALGGLGHVAAHRADTTLAQEQYNASLEICRQLNWEAGLAIRYRNLAQIDIKLGRIESATEYLNASLQLCQQMQYQQGEAHCCSSFGVIAQMGGRIDEAIEYHTRAYEMLTKLGDREGVAGELTNLGQAAITSAWNLFGMEEQQAGNPPAAQQYCALKLQRLDQAEQHLHQAYEIAGQLGHKENQAVVLGSLGRVYRLRNDFRQAEAMARQALTIHEEIGDRNGMAVEWTNIGAIRLEANDLQNAFDALDHARQLAEASQRADLLGEIYKELGIAMARGNEIGDACEYWQKAKQYLRQTNNQGDLAYVNECLQAAQGAV